MGRIRLPEKEINVKRSLCICFAAILLICANADNDKPRVGLRLIASGFTSAVQLVASPGDSGRLFVVDQIGVIKIIRRDGTLVDKPFLDVRSRMVTLNPNYDERGLLGLAFHPDYLSNGKFYVYYSAPLRPGGPAGWNHTSHISEFQVTSNPEIADPNSERIVMLVDEPQPNHNGGTLAFGPDNFLYISLGDGGAANDVGLGHNPTIGNGQDITTVLGKMLRIDVNGMPYAIPPDNPFAGGGLGRPEIFAFGFRNPYRFSFDSGGDNQLFVADVGQDLYEEVDIVENGGNYGWNIREGFHCFDPMHPTMPPPTCRDRGYLNEPLAPPIMEYGHPSIGGPGIAVVGGYVYHGRDIPNFKNRYVFGDWSTTFSAADGTLFIAKRHGNRWEFEEISIAGSPDGRLHHNVMGFGQDNDGELYVMLKDTLGPAGDTGKVYKLVRAKD